MGPLEDVIEKEKNAMTIYEALAEKTPLPGLKSLFVSMAHDEQYHLDIISAISEKPGTIMFYQPDLENLSRIFESVLHEQGLEGLSKELVAGCRQAMKNEETILRSYWNLLAIKECRAANALISGIMEQERKHLSVMKDLCVLISEQQSAG